MPDSDHYAPELTLVPIATLLAAAAKSSGSSLFLPIMIALFGLVYFLYLRPRQAKARADRENAKQVEVGEWIRTIGGLEGQVVATSPSHVVVRTGHVHGEGPDAASSTNLTFAKQAIAGKVDDPYAVAAPAEAPPVESGDETPEVEG